MKIRTRLALQFLVITSGMLLIFSFAIYYFSLRNQQKEFNTRLKNRALTTAQLLIKVDEVDSSLLNIIDKNTVNALYDEKIAVYDYRDKLIYHHERSGGPLDPGKDVLDKVRLNKEHRSSSGKEQLVGILFEQGFDRFAVIVSAKDVQGLTQIEYLQLLLIIGRS
jgi:hypothetical protein